MHRCPVPVLVTLHGGDIQSEQGKYVQVFFTRMILKRANAAIILNEPMRSLVTPLVKAVFQSLVLLIQKLFSLPIIELKQIIN